MTTQATHTKGPWRHCPARHRERGGLADFLRVGGAEHANWKVGARTRGSCLRIIETRGWDEGEDAANARLIAAAPDLLEALRGLIDQLEAAGIHIPGEDSGQWHGAEGISFSRAIEAIAKAEGRAE
jgi:hypothetical protein